MPTGTASSQRDFLAKCKNSDDRATCDNLFIRSYLNTRIVSQSSVSQTAFAVLSRRNLAVSDEIMPVPVSRHALEVC
jgi:hypothetical protein